MVCFRRQRAQSTRPRNSARNRLSITRRMKSLAVKTAVGSEGGGGGVDTSFLRLRPGGELQLDLDEREIERVGIADVVLDARFAVVGLADA